MLAVVAVASTALVGCNTFRGAGKDIQHGGEAMQNASTDVQYRNQQQQRQQYAIAATAQPGGSISPSGVSNATAGTNRTYSIQADNGFHVADVVIDGRSIGPVSGHTFDNIHSSHTIAASFARNPIR